MPKKLIQSIKYITHCLFSAALYGSLMYFAVYKYWIGVSALAAYLANIAFIILALASDKIINDFFLSKKFVITKKNYKIARFLQEDLSVSFKTAIYLFHTFILVISQMSANGFTFMSEDFMAFALSIEYCVLLVIAIDTFIGHLAKDMERTAKRADKLASLQEK